MGSRRYSRSSTDRRITVRLTAKENEQLAELVAHFKIAPWRSGFQRPPAPGRNYQWSEGDIVRLALAELHRQCLTSSSSPASDGKAIAASDVVDVGHV